MPCRTRPIGGTIGDKRRVGGNSSGDFVKIGPEATVARALGRDEHDIGGLVATAICVCTDRDAVSLRRTGGRAGSGAARRARPCHQSRARVLGAATHAGLGERPRHRARKGAHRRAKRLRGANSRSAQRTRRRRSGARGQKDQGPAQRPSRMANVGHREPPTARQAAIAQRSLRRRILSQIISRDDL